MGTPEERDMPLTAVKLHPASLHLEAEAVISPPAEAPVLQGTCAGRGDVGTRRRKTSVPDWPRRHTRWTGAL